MIINNINKKIFSFLVILFFISLNLLILSAQPPPVASEYTINLARLFSKDIFELNGVPYMQPLVESMNATSNSRFFNSAHVPSKVDKPYFRISVNGMMGFVRDDKKFYHPQLPGDTINYDVLLKYLEFNILDPTHPKIKDTAGLMHYAFRVYALETYKNGGINVPEQAPTVLGSGKQVLTFNKHILDSIVRSYPVVPGLNKPLYELLGDSLKSTLINTIGQFPEYFTLSEGSNLNLLGAAIPQFEIGALWGTELLIRLIPPVDMGKTIGKFAFWGFGIKHSISQYILKCPFDMAIQTAYQGTSLKNTVGVTQAKLTASADIFNISLQGSSSLWGVMDIFTGFSYEYIDISTNYLYPLPIEVQYQLGLAVPDPVTGQPMPPTADRPGDTKPQSADLNFLDRNFKWIIGLSKSFNGITIYADFNLSKFNIFSGGISYQF